MRCQDGNETFAEHMYESPYSDSPQTFLGHNSSHLKVDLEKMNTRCTNARLSPWCGKGDTRQVTQCSDTYHRYPKLDKMTFFGL